MGPGGTDCWDRGISPLHDPLRASVPSPIEGMARSQAVRSPRKEASSMAYKDALSGTKRRLEVRFDDRVAPLVEPGEQRIAGVGATLTGG